MIDANDKTDSRGAPRPPGSTSGSLVVALRGHSPEAWRRLAYLYGPLVESWCLRRGIPRADSEDVMQEVFLAVITAIERFRHEKLSDTFRGWLRRITEHKLADRARRRSRECTTIPLAVVPEAQTPSDVDDKTDAEDVAGLHARAVELVRGEVEERSWQAFWRVTVENQDPCAVAADLQMNRGAVYNAKSRILRRLREVLGEA
jgi:RNA polymerase sigma-70 factor (ECF subfamily)